MSESSHTERDQAEVRAFLSERDALCPRCGYNLRNMAAGPCPECGAVPRLGLIGPSRVPRGVLIPLCGMGWMAVITVLSSASLWKLAIRSWANGVPVLPVFPWASMLMDVVAFGIPAFGLVWSLVHVRRSPESAWWWAGVTLLSWGSFVVLHQVWWWL